VSASENASTSNRLDILNSRILTQSTVLRGINSDSPRNLTNSQPFSAENCGPCTLGYDVRHYFRVKLLHKCHTTGPAIASI